MCIIIFAVETLASKTLSDYCRIKNQSTQKLFSKKILWGHSHITALAVNQCVSERVCHECLSGLALIPFRLRGMLAPLDFILTQNKVIINEHP